MKITIRELRQRIVESIGTYDAVVIYEPYGRSLIILLDSTENFVAGIRVSRGMDEDWYTVFSMWATTAVSAVVLLETALKFYQRINPSEDVSPAAQSVIRRWATKNWKIGCVVENPGTDEEKTITSPPDKEIIEYGFLAPRGYGLSRALTPREPKNEQEANELKHTFTIGFSRTFEKKSKSDDLSLMLKLKMGEKLLLKLMSIIDVDKFSKDSDSQKPVFRNAQRFINTNKKQVESLINPETENRWQGVFQAFETSSK